MKDALSDADVSLDLQEAILGHSTGSGSQANYGKGHSLKRKQGALLKVFGAPEGGVPSSLGKGQ